MEYFLFFLLGDVLLFLKVHNYSFMIPIYITPFITLHLLIHLYRVRRWCDFYVNAMNFPRNSKNDINQLCVVYQFLFCSLSLFSSLSLSFCTLPRRQSCGFNGIGTVIILVSLSHKSLYYEETLNTILCIL